MSLQDGKIILKNDFIMGLHWNLLYYKIIIIRFSVCYKFIVVAGGRILPETC